MFRLFVCRSLAAMIPLLTPFLLIMGAESAVAARYVIPSGSMEPSLLIGDDIGTLNFSYGFSTAQLPFGHYLPHTGLFAGRLGGHSPRRGDVVVFRSPANPANSWVKRVIGQPGDQVALRDGRVFINGEMLPWRDRGEGTEVLSNGETVPARRYVETLPGGREHDIFKEVAVGALDNVAAFTVPKDRLFVMGDNRDNSADSRVPVEEGGVGLLPLWNVEGQAVVVLWSRDRLNPRWSRFFKAII